ncbi:uncharacterized protein LOC111102783 [Crassostrea virginica]
MCLIFIASVVRLCKDGYYGLKCRLRCPFPHFGEGCVLACNCSKELCHHVHGCKTTQGPGNHNTLNQTYRYSPLKEDLTSVSQLDNSEDRDQKFTKSFVHENDTVEFQQQESTMYLLRTAVVGLTFVVAVLFVSYLCLTYFMNRNRATHEDLIIINE